VEELPENRPVSATVKTAPGTSRAAGGFLASLPSWGLPAIILAVVVVLGVGLAIGVTIAGRGTTEGGYGPTPTVVGDILPTYQSGQADSALGMAVPQITGADYDGNVVAITTDGKPKLIVALAHWCPHCNNELPVLSGWYRAGLPAEVEVISLSVFGAPGRVNWPPSTWLDNAQWPIPVIADDQNQTIARALGIPAVPFWLLVGADGTVLLRQTGEATVEFLNSQIAALVTTLPGTTSTTRP
jgi:hypothetical protein